MGGYDIPIPPQIQDFDVDFICFSDNPNMPSNGWKIVSLPQVREGQANLTRTSRIPKILPHRFLNGYDRSLYIDANLEVTGSLQSLFARLDNVSAVFFEHPEGRKDIYEEADVCVQLGKDKRSRLIEQVDRYRKLGFDGRATSAEHPIPAGMAILRRHTDPAVVKAMEMWWSEYQSGSKRDQISLPYALRKSRVAFDLIHENVRKNIWFNWRPHHRNRALNELSKAYQKSGAIILHAPGAEYTAQLLMPDASLTAKKAVKRSWHRLLASLRHRPILFDSNNLGISPHGVPELGIACASDLAGKPVALLCDDPNLHESHAISSARRLGVEFENISEILASDVYGVARRLAFEDDVSTFLKSHSGPTAILHAQELERGEFTALSQWLGVQGRSAWPVKLRAFLNRTKVVGSNSSQGA